MKKKNKYKIFYFIIVSMLILIPTRLVIKDDLDNKKIINYKEEYRIICKNIEEDREPCDNVSNRLCEDSQENSHNKEDIDTYFTNYCKNIYPYDDGFMYSHNFIVERHYNSLCFILILVIISFSLIFVTNFLVNKVFISKLVRTKYSKVVREILSKTYSYIWILPFLLFISFIIQIIYFGYDNTMSIVNEHFRYWDVFLLKRPSLFIFLYLLNATFYNAAFINISLITARYSKNYIYSTIISFLIIVCIQLILEVVPFINGNVISLITILRFNTDKGLLVTFAVSISIFVISLLGVLCVYKNREKITEYFDQ